MRAAILNQSKPRSQIASCVLMLLLVAEMVAVMVTVEGAAAAQGQIKAIEAAEAATTANGADGGVRGSAWADKGGGRGNRGQASSGAGGRVEASAREAVRAADFELGLISPPSAAAPTPQVHRHAQRLQSRSGP